jgi:hypothetical protein
MSGRAGFLLLFARAVAQTHQPAASPSLVCEVYRIRNWRTGTVALDKTRTGGADRKNRRRLPGGASNSFGEQELSSSDVWRIRSSRNRRLCHAVDPELADLLSVHDGFLPFAESWFRCCSRSKRVCFVSHQEFRPGSLLSASPCYPRHLHSCPFDRGLALRMLDLPTLCLETKARCIVHLKRMLCESYHDDQGDYQVFVVDLGYRKSGSAIWKSGSAR